MSDSERRLDPLEPERDSRDADPRAEPDPTGAEPLPMLRSLDELLNAPAALERLDEPLFGDETPLMPVEALSNELSGSELPGDEAPDNGAVSAALSNDPFYDDSLPWDRMQALASEDSTPPFGVPSVVDDEYSEDEFAQTPPFGMAGVEEGVSGDTPPFGLEPIGEYSDREASLQLSLAAIDNLPLGSTASETWALEAAANAGDALQFGAVDEEADEPLLDQAEARQERADVVGFGTWGQGAARSARATAGARNIASVGLSVGEAPAAVSAALEHAQPAAPAEPDASLAAFEQISIAEMLGQLRRAPRTTTAALMRVLTTPPDVPPKPARASDAGPIARRTPALTEADMQRLRHAAPGDPDADEAVPQERDLPLTRGQEVVQLVLRLLGFSLAVFGTFIMQTSPDRSEAAGLNTGMPFLVIGLFVWLLSEGFQWAATRGQPSSTPPDSRTPRAPVPLTRDPLLGRSALALIGAACAFFAATLNTSNGLTNTWNLFTPPGTFAWVASIVCFVWVFAPAGWNPRLGLERAGMSIANWRPHLSWVGGALLAIMLITAGVRLYELGMTPREMTSDHVEMLLDTLRVQNGETNIFFANNGGREAFQFYALALFSRLPGQGLNFDTLKLLNVIEAVLSIPILFWLGRTLIGATNRRLGTWVGLGLAALVAVSLWHMTISRVAERIVLTPAVVSLILIFFVRGLRSGRRGDFILAGLALGFGLYTYQVIRMMPVVIGVGIAIALFLKPAWATRRALLAEFAIIAALSFVIFVPLLSYSAHYPEDFWRRSSGRLFGDEITQTEDENGNLIYRPATLEERTGALQANFPTLTSNLRNALLMFNWKGDVAWFQNAPNHPAFDPLTGGLLIVGIGAWAARMLRRREAADWLVPAAFFILILPSALAIAYPIENPSATRMSGTLPLVYLLAAFPAVLIGRSLVRLLGGFGRGLAVIGSVALVGGSLAWNAPVYLNDYDNSYTANSQPYSDVGGMMRRLHDGIGAGVADGLSIPDRTAIPYGNMFIIAYPYWWDHRAIGIAAGATGFPNTLPSLDDAPNFLRDAANRSGRDEQWRLDVNADLIFLYNPNDALADSWLRTMFPNGSAQMMLTYQPEDIYYLYRVSALGQASFDQFLTLSGAMSGG